MEIKFEEVAAFTRQEQLSVKEFLISSLETGRWPGREVLFLIAMRLLATIDNVMDGLEHAWGKIRTLESQIRFLEGRNYLCPNCGTKTVEPDMPEALKGKCVICLMEFSIPLLNDLRQGAGLDLGVTKRIESLNEENRELRERLTRLQEHVHKTGVYVPPEIMFGAPKQSGGSGNG